MSAMIFKKTVTNKTKIKKIPFVKTVTWQRLGYVLENVIEDRVTADKLFEQLRASSARMVYKPLSTSAEDNPSSRDRRWKININVEIETDDA